MGAAIPLCLLMLGGLSFVGVDHAGAATEITPVSGVAGLIDPAVSSPYYITGATGADANGNINISGAVDSDLSLVLGSTDDTLTNLGLGQAGGNDVTTNGNNIIWDRSGNSAPVEMVSLVGQAGNGGNVVFNAVNVFADAGDIVFAGGDANGGDGAVGTSGLNSSSAQKGGNVTVTVADLTIGGAGNASLTARDILMDAGALDVISSGGAGAAGAVASLTSKNGNISVGTSFYLNAVGGSGTVGNGNDAGDVYIEVGKTLATPAFFSTDGAGILRVEGGTGIVVTGLDNDATAGDVYLNALVAANAIDASGTEGDVIVTGLRLEQFNKNMLLDSVTYLGDENDIIKLSVDARALDDPLNTVGLNADGGSIYRELTLTSVGNVGSFGDFYEFTLPGDLQPGDTLLNVVSDSGPIGITNGALSINTPGRVKAFHRDLGSFDLIGGNVDANGDFDSRLVGSGIYVWNVGEGADGQLTASLDSIPGFTSYAMAQAARLAMVADAQTNLVTSGLYNMTRALDTDELGLKVFTSAYGASVRYDTGSHVDLDTFGFLVGAGWATDTIDGQRLLAGLFFEAGWGDYDSANSGRADTRYKANGGASYMGGGLMAKYTFPIGLYFDGSFRAGEAKLHFRSKDMGEFENSFDNTSATYIGGHLGAGYEWAIDETQALDFNTRVLWTHLNSDQTNSTPYNDRIDYQAADSVRWRTGARYNYAFDLGTGGTLKPFVGVAYEHEFNGDAKTNVDNRRTEHTPSLEGGTGIGELGLSWQATDNFSIDLTGHGDIGTRQGGGGNLSLKWEF